MISKELLSNVLNVKICTDDINPHVRSNMLVYDVLNNNEINTNHVNIYELAHKCKEWAYEQSTQNIGYYCIKTINYGKYSSGGFSGAGDSFIDEEITEPELVFRLCQWILDNKNQFICRKNK